MKKNYEIKKIKKIKEIKGLQLDKKRDDWVYHLCKEEKFRVKPNVNRLQLFYRILVLQMIYLKEIQRIMMNIEKKRLSEKPKKRVDKDFYLKGLVYNDDDSKKE